MGRVVVGVDGSESSKEALKWAADQARRTGSDLQVVSASLTMAVPDSSDPKENQHHGLQRIVTDVLGEDPKVDLHLEIVESRPVPALMKFANGADLLVVGCRGHGAFAGMLLGSVSRHCVTHAPCPVVVVHGHPPDATRAST
jgi:nucleotide-binding universal stress UspA family protein